jgi:hypothetical protein
VGFGAAPAAASGSRSCLVRGDATLHRFLVYDLGRRGRWSLVKQVAHRADPGPRISEVAGYGRDSLPVMEAAGVVLRTSLVADLVECPALGAVARQPQANPLLDNYEGTAVVEGRTGTIELISDDNVGATRITRALTLTARLR